MGLTVAVGCAYAGLEVGACSDRAFARQAGGSAQTEKIILEDAYDFAYTIY